MTTWQPPTTPRALFLFAGAIVVVIALGVGLNYMRSICDDQTIDEVSNGIYVAAVFHRDCGADESVHVNLRKQGSRFGSSFLMNTVDEGEVLAARNISRPIEARWTGPKSLVVSIPPDSLLPSPAAPRNYKGTRVTHLERSWRDVTITFERQP